MSPPKPNGEDAAEDSTRDGGVGLLPASVAPAMVGVAEAVSYEAQAIVTLPVVRSIWNWNVLGLTVGATG